MPEEGSGAITAEAGAEQGSNQQGATPPPGGNSGESANNQGRGWLAGMPADLRDNAAFQSMQKVGDLGRAYLEAQAKLDRAIVPPGDSARDDEIKAFRDKLGVPDNPEGYTFDNAGDEAFADAFRKTAHEVGLSPAQAQKVYADLMKASTEVVQRMQHEATQKRKEATEGLKSEWGDQYDTNDAAARRFAALNGGDFTEALTEHGLIDDPRVLRGLYRFANMISEDRLVEGRGHRSTGGGWEFPNTPGMS